MRKPLLMIALLALVGGLFLAACGGGEDGEPAADGAAEATEAPAAESPAEPASKPREAAPPSEVTVRIGEMFFRPDEPRLKAGKVTVKARNVGAAEHDIVMVKTDLPVDEMPMTEAGGPDYRQAGHVMFGGHAEGGHGAAGGDDIHVMPGATERIEVDLEPGRYMLVCSLPGHFQAGQHAALRVVG